MFILIEILLVSVAWWSGKIFANYFPSRRPPKIYSAIFGLLFGFALLSFFLIFRYYISHWIMSDQQLGIRIGWFGPLDPPAMFLYGFFSYGGAVSFYERPKP